MIICLEALHRPLKGIILVTQMHKIVFTLITLPMGLYWVIFCPSLCTVTFFMFLYFLRTIQLLHINFFRCSWHYSESYLVEETFLQNLFLLGVILGLIFGYAALFLTAVPHRNLWDFVQMFSVLLWQSIC